MHLKAETHLKGSLAIPCANVPGKLMSGRERREQREKPRRITRPHVHIILGHALVQICCSSCHSFQKEYDENKKM